jgi:hypothetical protein
MNIMLTSCSGPDGVLHLAIPVGAPHVEYDIAVNVRHRDHSSESIPQDEWEAKVLALAGSIDDPTFVRPEQLPLETRDSLS